MTEEKKSNAISQWKLIAGTVACCATVFGWFYSQTLEFKNAEIALLERQVKQLSEVGPVPTAVQQLKEQFDELRGDVNPLLAATLFDSITGRMTFGGMSSPTVLSRTFSSAKKLINEKKYDLALAEANEMDKINPGFIGARYIRFLVNKEKQFDDEAANYAIEIITEIPKGNRLLDVYSYS